MSIADPAIDLERTLRERFALERFRPGQREVIEDVLSGRDVLCVMPTGGGKSLCYQLPALLAVGADAGRQPADRPDEGPGRRPDRARAFGPRSINSTLDPGRAAGSADWKSRRGEYDLVYVAPERFRSGRFVGRS